MKLTSVTCSIRKLSITIVSLTFKYVNLDVAVQVFMLNIVMVSVILLNVILLIVVAPKKMAVGK